VAVVRKIPCLVRARDRSRRTCLHRRARADHGGARFKPGQFLPPALDDPAGGFWPDRGVLDCQHSAGSRPAGHHLRRSRARSRTRMERELAPGGSGLGQAAVREFASTRPGTPCCSRVAPASQRSRRSCNRSGPSDNRASCSSTAHGNQTSSSTGFSQRPVAREVPALRCSLVCEEDDGRSRWTRVAGHATLRDPIFYLSGPRKMLAALTAQLGGRREGRL